MAYVPPIMNPPTPYSGSIPGGRLTDGTIVTIQGEPTSHDGFSINFSASRSLNPLGTTGLHFNPRFKENTVVRNAFQHGAWGDEERSGGFPFHMHQLFEIIFLVKNHAFKIAVNGQHFCEFGHRIPKEQLPYLLIGKGIRVSFIKFESESMPPPVAYPAYPKSVYPSPYPSQPSVYVWPAAAPYPAVGYPGASQPIYNPPVPFSLIIPGGLSPGKMIFISGIPNANPTRFTTYFCVGNSYGGDVALTFDARFSFGSDRNVTVRNHRVGGNWGSEERHGSYFPFQPNASFDMIILVEPNAYKIAVNNQHFAEFNHRIHHLHSVGCLYIEGDVYLTQVRLQ